MKRIAILVILVLFLLPSCYLTTNRTVQFYANSTSDVVYGSYLTSIDSINHIFIDLSPPWSLDVEAEKGEYVLLTVSGDLADALTARIYVDGDLFREKNETGVILIQVGGYIE